MSERDCLEENINRLLQKHPHELRLSDDRKAAIMAALMRQRSPGPVPVVIGAVREKLIRRKLTTSAVAASIVLAVILGILLLNRSATRAYAVEQTVKALRRISTVHVIGTTWEGKRFQSWSKINPQTGKPEWVCIDETPHGYKISSTPKGSCVWDAEGNVVRRTNRIIASSDTRYVHLFEELSNRMERPREGDQITISTKSDRKTGKDVIVITAVTESRDYTVYVDPATKLPLRMEFARADNMVQISRTVDQIEPVQY